MTNRKLAMTLLISVLLIGPACSKQEEAKPAAVPKISLRFDWTTNISFAGDVVAMNQFDSQYGYEQECKQAGEGIDPVKMVISGVDQIGITTFDKLLAANEKGAGLVAIGFINNASPTVFLTRADQKFTEPRDFEGKTVGIMPGGSTEFVYRGFIKKTGVDASKVKEIPASFDINGFVNRQYDVKLAFIYVENIALDEKQVAYNMIEPRNFGVVFPGRVYFATKTWLDANRALAQNFVNATIKGWEYAMQNRDQAAQQLKAYDASIDMARERKSFDRAIPYFNGHDGQLLMVDESQLPEMVQILVDVGLVANSGFGPSVDLSLARAYYAK